MSTALETKPEQGTALVEKVTEYTAFMSEEKVKLSVRIVQDYICVPTRRGLVCNARDATKFMMLCRARRLNPFDGDAYMLGYDSEDGPTFSIITAHQVFLKRAEVHPEYDGMASGVIVTNAAGEMVDRTGDFMVTGDKLLGGWAIVYFKSRSHPMEKRLQLQTFDTGKSRWKKDAAGMICKCVEADALRSSFPTSLGGLYLDDEMPGIPVLPVPSDPTTIDAPPADQHASKSEALASRLKTNGHAAPKREAPAQGHYDEQHGMQRPERESGDEGAPHWSETMAEDDLLVTSGFMTALLASDMVHQVNDLMDRTKADGELSKEGLARAEALAEKRREEIRSQRGDRTKK